MSETPAETIRIAMEYESRKVAVLLAENQQDTKLICGLEEDVAAWKRSANESAAENQRLREALTKIATPGEFSLSTRGQQAFEIAREALAGDTE